MGRVGPASGSTRAYNDTGADVAFNRVNEWRLNRYLMGDPQFAPQAPAVDPMGPGGGGGGGWGGGGGGGGGGLNPADFDAYAAQAMKAIAGIQAVANPLEGMYGGAVDRDVAEARQAYAGIADRVSMEDPFLAMVAQAAPQVNREMEAFLQGQGMDTSQYGNAVDYANAQLRSGQDNWSNYAKASGANHLAGQRDMVDISRLQGENIVQGFEGQRTELAAIVAAQKAAEAQRVQQERTRAIMELLGMGLQYGKAPDISSLLGGAA